MILVVVTEVPNDETAAKMALGTAPCRGTEPIEEYRGLMPDEVLLRYDDAERSGLFAKFWVVTPTYYRTPVHIGTRG